jgi:aminoglycoside phosphotransferase (APT) family kinase protein
MVLREGAKRAKQQSGGWSSEKVVRRPKRRLVLREYAKRPKQKLVLRELPYRFVLRGELIKVGAGLFRWVICACALLVGG